MTAMRSLRFTSVPRQDGLARLEELLHGRAISRDELLQRVWRLDPRRIETRTIDMHIVSLREKLRDDPAAPKVLLTVRGQGYMIAR